MKLIPRSVSKIAAHIEADNQGPAPIQRKGALDGYAEQIKRWYCEEDLTAELVHNRLYRDYGLDHHYATTAHSCQRFKHKEVFVLLHVQPGEEGQVDFTYLGRF